MKKISKESKIDWAKIIIVLIILLLIVNLGKYITKNTKVTDLSQNMEITFFGLGEADSTLIRHGNKTLLIDTGEAKDSPYIIKAILDLGIKKIDYLILTHPDKDHIGGALDIIKYFKVGEIVQSSFQKGSELQNLLNEEVSRRQIPVIIPEKEYDLNIGQASIKIFNAEEGNYKKSNDNSLLTLINHGELNYFFGGDAEKKRINEALEYNLPNIKLYKVPHHGRINSGSEDMIKKLLPEIAIITSVEGDLEILEVFKKYNTEVYVTRNQTIRFLSNGIELEKL